MMCTSLILVLPRCTEMPGPPHMPHSTAIKGLNNHAMTTWNPSHMFSSTFFVTSLGHPNRVIFDMKIQPMYERNTTCKMWKHVSCRSNFGLIMSDDVG